MSAVIDIEKPNIPEDLKPVRREDKAQTESLAVAARKLDPGEIEEVKRQFGLHEWSATLVTDLSKIGFDCEKVGISRINKGALMVGQEANLIALQEMKKILQEAKQNAVKIKVAGVIAKLNAAIAENVKASGVDTVAKSIADDGKVRRASPAKGATMGPAPINVTVLPEMKSG